MLVCINGFSRQTSKRTISLYKSSLPCWREWPSLFSGLLSQCDAVGAAAWGLKLFQILKQSNLHLHIPSVCFSPGYTITIPQQNHFRNFYFFFHIFLFLYEIKYNIKECDGVWISLSLDFYKKLEILIRVDQSLKYFLSFLVLFKYFSFETCHNFRG